MRVLADTSVWVDHWRRGLPAFAAMLEARRAVMHPFVVGELALGALHPRSEVLAELAKLPRTRIAEYDEVLGLVERRRLWGRGVGWVDCNLLASALLDDVRLWSLDRNLAAAAADLGIAAEV